MSALGDCRRWGDATPPAAISKLWDPPGGHADPAEHAHVAAFIWLGSPGLIGERPPSSAGIVVRSAVLLITPERRFQNSKGQVACGK